MRATFLGLSIAVLLAAAPGAAAQFPKGKPSDIAERLQRIEQQLNQLAKQLDELRVPRGPRFGAFGGLGANAPPAPEGGPGAEKAPQVHIYTLKHANAQDLAELLRGLFRLAIGVDVRTNSLVVAGDAQEIIEAIVGRLDVPVEAKERKQTTTEKKIEDKKFDEKKFDEKKFDEKKGRLEELRLRRELAQADLEQRRERLAWTERMAKKRFLAQSQVEAESVRLRAAEAALNRVEAELRALGDAKPK
jgi:hypothetical protein